jgi:hypothetical protein
MRQEVRDKLLDLIAYGPKMNSPEYTAMAALAEAIIDLDTEMQEHRKNYSAHKLFFR